ncbi:MAG: MogA/MoaB family molybdenum cofactor biosynthesis protein [Planctomycetota bacterium]|jgi:molybdenum cofactor biosynthesis protein B
MTIHPHADKVVSNVGCGIVTVSDSRTFDNDTSGQTIARSLEAAGHVVIARDLVPDDPAPVSAAVHVHLQQDSIHAVLLTGGTGLAERDNTVEEIRRSFDKEIPGFGELFRMLSFDDIGPAAMLSRATAGIIDGKAVFCMPGSTGAVRLAMDKLIIPQLGHLAWLLTPSTS